MQGRILTHVRSWARSTSGNIGTALALGALPVFGAAGITFDYIGAVKHHTSMQVAADAAALAGAQPGKLSINARKAIAKMVFEASLARNKVEQSLVHDLKIQIHNDTISVVAAAEKDTTLLGLFGRKKVDLKVKAAAELAGNRKIEVALALDYSGSVDTAGAYQAMRGATIELVETLSGNGQNKNVKFSIVPVSIHAPAARTGANHASGGFRNDCSTSECQNHAAGNPALGEMSSDFNRIISQLRELGPHDLKSMSLGWQLLSATHTVTRAGITNTDNTERVFVWLAAGEPSGPVRGPRDEHTTELVDRNIEELCQGLKSNNISVVTVAFGIHEGKTKQRLRNCATSPAHFFDATDTIALASAFDEIGQKLAGPVRLIE